MKNYWALIGILVIQSCTPEPDSIPNIPQIKFESISMPLEKTPGPNKYDSLIITTSYLDGDKDLGLDSETDTLQKFDYLNPDSTKNENYFNFHLKVYLEVDGNYELIHPDSMIFYSRFRRIPKQGGFVGGLTSQIWIKAKSDTEGTIILRRKFT